MNTITTATRRFVVASGQFRKSPDVWHAVKLRRAWHALKAAQEAHMSSKAGARVK